ncbi:hypothetical protein Tco_0735754 [Tanacetum coccineum]
MENANPFIPAPPLLPTALRTKVVQELNELQAISACINSRLENIDQFLNDLDDDSDNGEVLNKLEEYGNVGKLCRKKEITNRIAFRKFFQEYECEIFTMSGDGVRIKPNGVIFDAKKPESS